MHLNKEALFDRDVKMFEMRKRGHSIAEVASKFSVASTTVTASLKRTLERLNKDALMAYPEVLRMELERLDQLQSAVWPLTQHRTVKLPDGTKMVVEPDPKFVQQALNIMNQRMKLLGLEQTNINLNVESEAVSATLSGQTKATAIDVYDPKSEALALLEIMGSSGVMPREMVEQITGRQQLELPESSGNFPTLAEIEEQLGPEE